MSGLIWAFSGAAVTAAGCLLLWYLQRRRRQARLLSLTEYLEAASCGREVILTRTEDEFSLLEDELCKTVGQLRLAQEQAQRARQQQADNLADIAHQLKTPLTSMSLMTQLLAADADAGQQEYVARLGGQLGRLEWLTGALLTMSRLDAGAVVFTPASLCFEELAARALESMEQSLRERGQKIVLHGGDAILTCDPHWTAEALVNLIKNCSEHTPSAGLITLSAGVTPLYAQITVEDTGPGFTSDDLPCLFRRFYRGKNSAKDSIGIGLALSRGIVEGQSGMLRAENRLEGGARFVIRFYP